MAHTHLQLCMVAGLFLGGTVSWVHTGSAAEKSAAQLLQAAGEASAQGNSSESVRLATAAIKLDDKISIAYYLRGREQFRLGKVKESVKDFDKHVELSPDRASRQWERGMACYYAGQCKQGADQFKLYQTFHDNDVENSVWRYLCVARTEGVEKARSTILPIKNDRRVPMMQVFHLFRGQLQPADVLKAVEQDSPQPAELAYRMFYARLYLGLYYEVHGKPELARQYIFDSVDKHKTTKGINRYMWDVARIHKEQLQKNEAAQESKDATSP